MGLSGTGHGKSIPGCWRSAEEKEETNKHVQNATLLLYSMCNLRQEDSIAFFKPSSKSECIVTEDSPYFTLTTSQQLNEWQVSCGHHTCFYALHINH